MPPSSRASLSQTFTLYHSPTHSANNAEYLLCARKHPRLQGSTSKAVPGLPDLPVLVEGVGQEANKSTGSFQTGTHGPKKPKQEGQGNTEGFSWEVASLMGSTPHAGATTKDLRAGFPAGAQCVTPREATLAISIVMNCLSEDQRLVIAGRRGRGLGGLEKLHRNHVQAIRRGWV